MSSACNNLPADLARRAEQLLAGGGRRRNLGLPTGENVDGANGVELVHGRFTPIRRVVPIVPDFAPRVDLPHPELQSVIVVGPPEKPCIADLIDLLEGITAKGLEPKRYHYDGIALEAHVHGNGISIDLGQTITIPAARKT